MSRAGIRLSRRHQAWVYGTLGVLFASGVLDLAARFGLRGQGPFGETRSPLEPSSLKLHGAAAMAFLLLLGTLLPGHVRRAWQAGLSRVAGALLLGLNGLLILSGYGLYYLGGEGTRRLVSPLHWAIGLLLPVGLAWHIREGRRLRRKRTCGGGPPRDGGGDSPTGPDPRTVAGATGPGL
jgi:hypothetical protein